MTSINGDTVITSDAPHHATSASTMVGAMLEI